MAAWLGQQTLEVNIQLNDYTDNDLASREK